MKKKLSIVLAAVMTCSLFLAACGGSPSEEPSSQTDGLPMDFSVVERRDEEFQFQNIDDSIYWIFFATLILVVSIFPQIAIWASELLDIQSPANFVFLFISFMIVIKLFQVSIDCSVQKHRLNHLVQKLALLNYEQEQINKEKEKEQTLIEK